MRTQLADWINRPVQYTGFIEHWNYTPRQTAILLRELFVRTWVTPVTLARHVDHFWIYIDGRVDLSRLNNPYTGTGIVQEYIRRGGTKDYGIQNLSDALHIAHLLNQIELSLKADHPRKYRNAIARLEQMMNAIDQHRVCGSWGCSLNKLKEMTGYLLGDCRVNARYEEQQEAQLSKTRHLGLQGKGIVKPSGRRDSKSQGFCNARSLI